MRYTFNVGKNQIIKLNNQIFHHINVQVDHQNILFSIQFSYCDYSLKVCISLSGECLYERCEFWMRQLF